MSADFPGRWVSACTGLRDRLRVNYPDVVIPTTGDRLAVIVEMRNDPFLEVVMEIYIRQLAGRGWRVCLVHGTANHELANQIQGRWPGLETLYLNVDNFTVKKYNRYLLSPRTFWNLLPGAPRVILRFELDTVLISGDLDKFCAYEYVGAPWHPRMNWAKPNGRVGNGGLTIRSVEAMVRAIKMRWTPAFTGNEDGFFSVLCQDILQFAPVEVAREFAVESWAIEDGPVPCGFHKPWQQLGERAMTRIYKILNTVHPVVGQLEGTGAGAGASLTPSTSN